MMSRAAKTELSFRVMPRTLERAHEDARRRGCTIERWAAEVFEAFADAGYHAALPAVLEPLDGNSTSVRH